MATQVTNYQCPACTGPLRFSGESGKLECDHCGSKFDVAEIEALYAQKEAASAQVFEEEARRAQESGGWDDSGMTEEWGPDGEKLRVYNCPSCGAQLLCEETTAATQCPYCGNPGVVPGQLAGTLKPDLVLPFRLSQEEVQAVLRRHCKKGLLLPRAFSSEQHIKEVKGVYVPFWLFDGEADADVTYHATRSSTFRRGDYRITETRHFQVHRAGTVAFEKIPVDGSEKMPDGHMDGIEPFDYSGLKPFSTAYLPGFLADKYDVSVDQSAPRADRRAVNTALDAMGASVLGYETVTVQAQDVRLRRGKVHYALLPVYMLTTHWRDRTFLFAVNGQTGKVAGSLPVDQGRYWALLAALTVGFTVVFPPLISLIFRLFQ